MMSTNKVPMLCRFGGNFIWESNKVYYKEGTNRIVHVDRAINYLDLLSKACEICKLTDVSSIKYKYPGQDLDSLVSIEDDDDVSNMMAAFLCSSDPIHLFVFGAQKLSIPIPIPSNLMQNADNGNDEALLWDLHGSNGTLAHSSHNTNANNNDVSNVSNDLPEMDCLLMDNQELPCRVVDSCVNDMARMIPALKEGQEFEDSNTFLNTLREHAICSNFEYKRTKSSMFYYKAKCIKDNCSWRIYACKLLGEPTFKIESLKGNHTCIAANESTMSSKRKHRQASRIWIAGLVKDRLQKNLRCTPKDIVDEISQKYGIKVSYDKAWRGKELALNEMDSEPIVRALCKKIEMTNPGSTAKLDRSSNNSLRLFVAYKAAIHGFKQACRPIVFLECAEIEGKHRGTRLFAIAMDAEHNRFPISCAFVESEKVGSWKWFCDELAQILGCIPKLTFISNREDGILEVVHGIFPYACHQYNQWRLIEEIVSKFKCWDLRSLLEDATYATDRSKFDACMCEIHDKSINTWNFVKDINPKHWAISHVKEMQCVSNFCYMDIRSWGLNCINLPINCVLRFLHACMMNTFNERFKQSSEWDTFLVPSAQEVISTAERLGEPVSVIPGPAEFMVGKPISDAKKVDLNRQTCSCYYWQKFGFPCYHAIAAIRYSGHDVYDYFDVHYTVAKYVETYSEVIHPLSNKRQSRLKKYIF